MISARMFILCFCACVFGIEGARTQTKGIETALEKATKEQEAISESITGEAEAEDTEEGNLQPKGCKPHCNRAEYGNPASLELGTAIPTAFGMIMTKCNDKRCEQCSWCLEAAETKINVEPPLEDQRVSEGGGASHADADGEHEAPKHVVPSCTAPATRFEKECKLIVDNGEELTCAHYKENAWCNLETAGVNPGPDGRYRYHDEGSGQSWPLCCKTRAQMSEKIVTNVEESREKILTELETQRKDPEANREREVVPVCSDHAYQKETLIDGRIVCRDQETNGLYGPACCDEEVSGELAKKAAADAFCSEVKEQHCRSNAIFEKKRKSNWDIDEGYTCMRKYMCCFQDGSICFGPVSSHAKCNVINTETLEVLNIEMASAMTKANMTVKNLPATRDCVAVAKRRK